jgi:hypothetical protein
MSSQGTALGGGVLAAALFEVLATEKILTQDPMYGCDGACLGQAKRKRSKWRGKSGGG